MSCDDDNTPTLPYQTELPAQVEGDTWDEILFGPVLINNAPPGVDLVLARLVFRMNDSDFQPAWLATTAAPQSGEGTMTIVSAPNWSLRFPAQSVPLKAGTWRWDIVMVDATAVTKTYVGGTVTIAPKLH